MKEFTLELGTILSECPRFWQKFIKELKQNPDNVTSMLGKPGLKSEVLKEELSKYNAVYHHRTMGSNSYVLFETEEDLLVFKLKVG